VLDHLLGLRIRSRQTIEYPRDLFLPTCEGWPEGPGGDVGA